MSRASATISLKCDDKHQSRRWLQVGMGEVPEVGVKIADSRVPFSKIEKGGIESCMGPIAVLDTFMVPAGLEVEALQSIEDTSDLLPAMAPEMGPMLAPGEAPTDGMPAGSELVETPRGALAEPVSGAMGAKSAAAALAGALGLGAALMV